MNNENCKINENLLPSVYVKQARDSLKAKDNAIQNLLDHVCIFIIFLIISKIL